MSASSVLIYMVHHSLTLPHVWLMVPVMHAGGLSLEYLPRCKADIHPMYVLVCAGYLSPTPREPRIVLSLCSLELLHSLFWAAPAFGVQHFAWLMSDMHKVSSLWFSPSPIYDCHWLYIKVMYQSHLRTWILLTFNIFYWILHHLDGLSKHALNQAEPGYCLKNSCPACHYKVCLFYPGPSKG